MLDFWEKHKVPLSIAAGTIAAILIGIWLWNVFSGEERRIRKFVLQGKKAVESGAIVSCAQLVSQNYQDKYGNDRQGILFAAKNALTYYKKIEVDIKDMEIILEKEKTRATVDIKAEVTGSIGPGEKEKIMEADKDRIRLRLDKEKNKWYLLELEFFGPVFMMERDINQGHE